MTDIDVGVNVGVNATESQILELIAKDGFQSAVAMASILGISKRQVERVLKSLKDKALITRIGSDKTGYWEVKA